MLRLGFTCLIFSQVCSSCIYRANVFETSSFQGENSDIYLMLGGNHLKTSFNRKAFQWDAYRPLANRTFFSSHQMSAPREGGTQVNKFEQVSSLGHQISLAGGRAGGPCSMRSHIWGVGSACTVRSHGEEEAGLGRGEVPVW